MKHSTTITDHVLLGYRWQFWRNFFIGIGLIAILGAFVYWRYFASIPVEYSKDSDHFLYGSIGSDYDGIPLAIWKILPETFPEYLPNSGRDFLKVVAQKESKGERPADYRDGYAQFGFLIQDGHPLPVGFSQRRVYVDRVGLNCAVCHTGTLAVQNGDQAAKIYGDSLPTHYVGQKSQAGAGRVMIYGMPAHSMDLESYFTFLFRCAEDGRFNADTLVQAIDQAAEKGTCEPLKGIDRIIVCRSVYQLRETLLTRRRQLHYLNALAHQPGEDQTPRFGPGRIDTFSPYKSIQFGFPFDGTYGIADYPSIWNQRPREGMQLHWDGNNESVFERNISASLGAGVTPISLDMKRMLRVARWIGSPPPPNPAYQGVFRRQAQHGADKFQPFHDEMPIPNYPFKVDTILANKGRLLFREYCAHCHGDWSQATSSTNSTSVTPANTSIENANPEIEVVVSKLTQSSTVPGLGKVLPIGDIDTDPARLDSYTESLQANQNQLGSGQWWRFTHFRKTNGYANGPLDGIWIKAPYLHNGSVPSLYDLFSRPCSTKDLAELGITATTDLDALAVQPKRVAEIIAKSRSLGLRPPIFYRGDDAYDEEHGGFRSDRDRTDDGRSTFFYSTIQIENGVVESLLGNGHQGHYGKKFNEAASFGSELTSEEKRALVEFQKLIGSDQAKELP